MNCSNPSHCKSIGRLYWIGLLAAASLMGCYSFKGISINPNVNSYRVEVFQDNTSQGAPADLPYNFTSVLDKQIRTETRLKVNEDNPDIVFNGKLLTYRVTPGPISREESTTFNRLEVAVQVQYVNHVDTKDKWSQTFSHFEEFPTDQNLIDVQDELLKKIMDKIAEDIFNKAFTNW